TERAPTGSPRMRTLRFAFATGQSALAMVLVVGAALLLQSYLNLVSEDVGFDEKAVVADTSDPADAIDRRSGDIRRVVDGLRRIPGVAAAGAGVGTLVDSARVSVGATIGTRRVFSNWFTATPDFFDAAGMTIVAGRPFAAVDRSDSVVLVNEALAREAWPNELAVGQTVQIPLPNRGLRQVVGVVGDARTDTLDSAPRPTIYVPLDALPPVVSGHPTHYVMQVAGDPDTYRSSV